MLELKTIQVAGKSICITRTAEGFWGITTRCPHQGGALDQGFCTPEGKVICPWHHYEFDLKTGRDKTGHHAQLYPVQVKEDGVYVGIEKGYWSFF